MPQKNRLSTHSGLLLAEIETILLILQNYRIPKGWTVVYNIRDTHEYESEDMDTFEPDRFAGVGKDGKENKYR